MSELNSTLELLKTYYHKIERREYEIDIEWGKLVDNIVYDYIIELIKNNILNKEEIEKVFEYGLVKRIIISVIGKLEEMEKQKLKKLLRKSLEEPGELVQMIERGKLLCELVYEPIYDYDDILIDTCEKIICRYRLDEEEIETIRKTVEETIKEVLKL
ncbi:MAG: hypothetical protein QXW71_05840 [Thermoplasmata archaeon]